MKFGKGLAAGLVAAIVIFWLFSRISCHKQEPSGESIKKETDTVLVQVAGEKVYVPIPVKTTSAKAVNDTIWITDTIGMPTHPDPEECCDYYAYMLKLCSDTSFYSDLVFLDTTKRSYVVVTDTVTTNKIIGRGLKYNWVYPVITNSTTITKKEKQRLQLLVGGGIAGTKTDPLRIADLDAMIRGKKGGAIGLNIKFDLNNNVTMYGFKKLWLISFRKK